MSERRLLGSLAREPLYNTRAVVQATGVPADTIRAWERRYGFPRPFRTSSNQRRYAERDIGVITWLRERTDEGMTISQAIQRLRLEFPELIAVERPPATTAAPIDAAPDPQDEQLRRRLLDACIAFDTAGAERAIDEGLARFSVEAFCARLVEPALHEIGDRWRRHDLSVAAEHFATRLFTRRLAAIFTIACTTTGRGTVVAACPPGEEHEIGLLVLSIVLCRRGWRVIYLGANLPADELVGIARAIQPDLVCLSATTDHAAAQAIAVANALQGDTRQPPVVLGGRAFPLGGVLRTAPGTHIIAGSANEAIDIIDGLIESEQVGGQRGNGPVAGARAQRS